MNGLARGGAVVMAPPGPRLPEFVIRVAVLPVLVVVARKPSDDQQFRLIVSIAIAAIVVTARLQEDSTMVVLQLPFNWLTSYSFACSYGVVSKGTVPHHLFVSFADDRNQHEMYTLFVRNASLAKRSRGHTQLFSGWHLTFALNFIVKKD